MRTIGVAYHKLIPILVFVVVFAGVGTSLLVASHALTPVTGGTPPPVTGGTPPKTIQAPTGVGDEFYNYQGQAIIWKTPVEPAGDTITGYYVYRDGVQINPLPTPAPSTLAEEPLSANTWYDTLPSGGTAGSEILGTAAGHTYVYTVAAVINGNVLSPVSAPFTLTIPPLPLQSQLPGPPNIEWFRDLHNNGQSALNPGPLGLIQPPTNLHAVPTSSGSIMLLWWGSSPFVSYSQTFYVYQAGITTPIDQSQATQASDGPSPDWDGWIFWNVTGLKANTQYCYNVAAFDYVSNIGPKTPTVCATTLAPGVTAPLPDTCTQGECPANVIPAHVPLWWADSTQPEPTPLPYQPASWLPGTTIQPTTPATTPKSPTPAPTPKTPTPATPPPKTAAVPPITNVFGTVRNSKGTPIAGVHVYTDNNKVSSYTNVNGVYVLLSIPPNDRLVYHFVATHYKTVTPTEKFAAGNFSFNVYLKSS